MEKDLEKLREARIKHQREVHQSIANALQVLANNNYKVAAIAYESGLLKIECSPPEIEVTGDPV